MAVPNTIFSGTGATDPIGYDGYAPIHQAPNGSFYCVLVYVFGASELFRVFKSDDPEGGTWTVQDSAHEVQSSVSTNWGTSWPDTCLSTCLAGDNGDKLCAASYETSSSNQVRFHVFDTSDDTHHSTASLSIGSGQSDYTGSNWNSVHLAGRSNDGKVIVVYDGTPDAVKGDDKMRVDWARVDPDTLPPTVDTSNNMFGTGGDVHNGAPRCVTAPSGTDIHIFHNYESDNSLDPPADWQYFRGQTIDSSDNVNASSLTILNSTKDAPQAVSHACAYNNGTADRSAILMYQSSGSYTTAIVGEEDASGYWQYDTPGLYTDIWSGGADVNSPAHGYFVASLAYDDTDDRLYSVFSGGTTPADEDMYLSYSDNDGVSWSTPTEILDAVTVAWLSASFLTFSNGKRALGIIYYDESTSAVRYYEYVIDPGSTAYEDIGSFAQRNAQDMRLRL